MDFQTISFSSSFSCGGKISRFANNQIELLDLIGNVLGKTALPFELHDNPPRFITSTTQPHHVYILTENLYLLDLFTNKLSLVSEKKIQAACCVAKNSIVCAIKDKLVLISSSTESKTSAKIGKIFYLSSFEGMIFAGLKNEIKILNSQLNVTCAVPIEGTPQSALIFDSRFLLVLSEIGLSVFNYKAHSNQPPSFSQKLSIENIQKIHVDDELLFVITSSVVHVMCNKLTQVFSTPTGEHPIHDLTTQGEILYLLYPHKIQRIFMELHDPTKIQFSLAEFDAQNMFQENSPRLKFPKFGKKLLDTVGIKQYPSTLNELYSVVETMNNSDISESIKRSILYYLILDANPNIANAFLSHFHIPQQFVSSINGYFHLDAGNLKKARDFFLSPMVTLDWSSEVHKALGTFVIDFEKVEPSIYVKVLLEEDIFDAYLYARDKGVFFAVLDYAIKNKKWNALILLSLSENEEKLFIQSKKVPDNVKFQYYCTKFLFDEAVKYKRIEKIDSGLLSWCTNGIVASEVQKAVKMDIYDPPKFSEDAIGLTSDVENNDITGHEEFKSDEFSRIDELNPMSELLDPSICESENNNMMAINDYVNISDNTDIGLEDNEAFDRFEAHQMNSEVEDQNQDCSKLFKKRISDQSNILAARTIMSSEVGSAAFDADVESIPFDSELTEDTSDLQRRDISVDNHAENFVGNIELPSEELQVMFSDCIFERDIALEIKEKEDMIADDASSVPQVLYSDDTAILDVEQPSEQETLVKTSHAGNYQEFDNLDDMDFVEPEVSSPTPCQDNHGLFSPVQKRKLLSSQSVSGRFTKGLNLQDSTPTNTKLNKSSLYAQHKQQGPLLMLPTREQETPEKENADTKSTFNVDEKHLTKLVNHSPFSPPRATRMSLRSATTTRIGSQHALRLASTAVKQKKSDTPKTERKIKSLQTPIRKKSLLSRLRSEGDSQMNVEEDSLDSVLVGGHILRSTKARKRATDMDI